MLLAAGILLAAAAVALALSLVQVSRSVASNLNLTSTVQVLSSGDMGLWRDINRTEELTSLDFKGVLLQPPMIPRVQTEVVFIENLSTGDLELVEPCRNVESPPGTKIGSMNARISDLRGSHLGWMCDRPGVKLLQGQMVRGTVLIELEPGLASGDYPFEAVFGAVGSTGDH